MSEIISVAADLGNNVWFWIGFANLIVNINKKFKKNEFKMQLFEFSFAD